jgi:hypothetical protein
MTKRKRTKSPVPGWIIRPMISASVLTWFIRYIFYRNLHFLNHVIITKIKMSSLGIGDLSRFWLACVDPLAFFFCFKELSDIK